MADNDKEPDQATGQENTEPAPQDANTTSPGVSVKEPDTSLESDPDAVPEASSPSATTEKKKDGRLTSFRKKINIYLLLFGVVVIMILIIVGIAFEQSQQSGTTDSLKTQKLNQSTLDQLANSDSTLGSSQYILNVESSAIFAGQVILKQNVQVAGNLQVGGTGSFNDISVAGTGQFDQASVTNNLSVGGNTAIQGSATINKSLQVSSGGNFGGPLSAPQITTSILSLNGDLVIQHHVSVSGSVPGRTSGTALGGGGTVSVSGADTAGSISINTGSSPAAGCFITVTFATPFNQVPHVLVTPIGSAAGGLSYYVNRSTTSFSICDDSSPPSGSAFGFDYFVID